MKDPHDKQTKDMFESEKSIEQLKNIGILLPDGSKNPLYYPDEDEEVVDVPKGINRVI